MKILIKSIRGSVKVEGDFTSLAEALNKNKADLTGANLRGADLEGADLTGANLEGADLTGANLRGADLEGADLTGANLEGANLTGANLGGADLGGANLGGANLTGADLTGANLTDADLTDANLRGADLRGADLGGAKNSELAVAVTRILPDGDIIGWKKCRNGVIIKLLIRSGSKRSHAFGRKCRAESAKVLEVFGASEGVSDFDSDFVYRVGDTVKCEKPFCEDFTQECASGIHFFVTRMEAEAYNI